MKPALVLLCHIGFDAAFGWTLLNYRRHARSAVETFLAGILLGVYVETLSVATLMFLGLTLSRAAIATAVGMTVFIALTFRPSWQHSPRLVVERLHWYEWAALGAVGEKVLFAIWQLARFDTYFDDALMHWSGRARSLYAGANWSMDANSPFFMGNYIGYGNYPMLTVIWRALTAALNGGWTEVISRADGLIFFTVVVGTVWAAVRRFSDKRWLAAAAAFTVCAVPLQVWHSVAGYSDIALEAFLVVAFAAVLRGEWLVGGIMAAGAAWSKNDALVLYIPALLLGVLLVHAQQWNWRKVGSFLAGLATITPWLAFNFAHSLGITPARPQVSWHSDSLKLLWDAVFTTATSGILWVCILLCAVYLWPIMFNDTLGRALILSFSLSVLAIAFIFTSTSAYAFLADETTIHRTLLQLSATAIVIISYGLSLRLRQAREPQRATQTRKRS